MFYRLWTSASSYMLLHSGISVTQGSRRAASEVSGYMSLQTHQLGVDVVAIQQQATQRKRPLPECHLHCEAGLASMPMLQPSCDLLIIGCQAQDLSD